MSEEQEKVNIDGMKLFKQVKPQRITHNFTLVYLKTKIYINVIGVYVEGRETLYIKAHTYINLYSQFLFLQVMHLYKNHLKTKSTLRILFHEQYGITAFTQFLSCTRHYR